MNMQNFMMQNASFPLLYYWKFSFQGILIALSYVTLNVWKMPFLIKVTTKDKLQLVNFPLKVKNIRDFFSSYDLVDGFFFLVSVQFSLYILFKEFHE